jgi:hypothetical protein
MTAGELYVIPREEELRDVLQCTCGRPLMECPFWGALREKLADGDKLSWKAHARTLEKSGTLGQAIALTKNRKSTPPLDSLLRGKERLYRLIAEEAGAHTVVDTGRNPFIAVYLLANIPGMKVLHLVRHGEDFLYSKLHRMQSGKGFKWYRYHWTNLHVYAPYIVLGSISWFLGNLLCEYVRWRYPDRVKRVRYEDICADPSGELRKLGEWIGCDPSGVIEKVRAGEALTIKHMYNGNPLARLGPFVFRPDVNKPLPLRYRIIFRLIAWPLMWKYGYFRRAGRTEPLAED